MRGGSPCAGDPREPMSTHALSAPRRAAISRHRMTGSFGAGVAQLAARHEDRGRVRHPCGWTSHDMSARTQPRLRNPCKPAEDEPWRG